MGPTKTEILCTLSDIKICEINRKKDTIGRLHETQDRFLNVYGHHNAKINKQNIELQRRKISHWKNSM